MPYMQPTWENLEDNLISEKWMITLEKNIWQSPDTIKNLALSNMNQVLIKQGYTELVSNYENLDLSFEMVEDKCWRLCFIYPANYEKDIRMAFVHHVFLTVDDISGPIIEIEGVPRRRYKLYPIGPRVE